MESQASHKNDSDDRAHSLQAVKIIGVACNHTGMHDAGLPSGNHEGNEDASRCEDGGFV